MRLHYVAGQKDPGNNAKSFYGAHGKKLVPHLCVIG